LSIFVTAESILTDEETRVQALEQHAAQLAAIVNSVKLAVISVDEAQNIVLFNAEAEAIFRCSAAQALGGPLERFIPVNARAAHRQHIANYDGGSAGQGTRTMGGERILTGLRADGEVFPIDATITRTEAGGRKLYTVILRDVSERVRHHAELRRYADIIDASGDAILSRALDGTVITWNPAAQRLFGYTHAEIVGSSVDVLYSPNTPPAERDLAARVARGETIVNYETLRRHKNGTDIAVAITLSALRDAQGKVIATTAILRDITERKRMEAELRRLHQEQQRAEAQMRESRDRLRELSSALQTIREEEKSRIARELHDELGQALTALKMDAAAIETELDHAQSALRQRTEGMKQLIDTTVASVRRISADLRPVMLDNLGLMPTLEWLAREFTQRTGIPIDLDLPEEDLGVSGDAATAIFRITQEALTNVSRHSRADWVGIEVKRHGGNVEVRISDNGKGFTEAQRRKVRSFGLLGMHERAFVLGGELTVSSPPSGGTQIEAVIPIFGVGQRGGA
jgi:PAS domain S-box-containing protein